MGKPQMHRVDQARRWKNFEVMRRIYSSYDKGTNRLLDYFWPGHLERPPFLTDVLAQMDVSSQHFLPSS